MHKRQACTAADTSRYLGFYLPSMAFKALTITDVLDVAAQNK